MVGGDIAKDWTEDCTHLVMESVTFTIKVLQIKNNISIYNLRCFLEGDCNIPDTLCPLTFGYQKYSDK